MKFAFAIILLLSAIAGTPEVLHAQSITIDSSNKSIDISGSFNNAEVHLAAVKKRPQFPGGKKAWQDFLRSAINRTIPITNKAMPGNYKIMIRFIVGSTGKLRGIGADSNGGYGMENEVIRCIKKSPEWIPAETDSGRKVSFTLRTIVNFIVTRNNVVINFL